MRRVRIQQQAQNAALCFFRDDKNSSALVRVRYVFVCARSAFRYEKELFFEVLDSFPFFQKKKKTGCSKIQKP